MKNANIYTVTMSACQHFFFHQINAFNLYLMHVHSVEFANLLLCKMFELLMKSRIQREQIICIYLLNAEIQLELACCVCECVRIEYLVPRRLATVKKISMKIGHEWFFTYTHISVARKLKFTETAPLNF